MVQTEISTALQGKEASFQYDQMAKQLDDQVAQVRAKMRSGLDRTQYDLASDKVAALLAAKLILKTIQIYHVK